MLNSTNSEKLNLSREDLEILQEFIAESKESIEEIEPILIELEEHFNGLEQVEPALINKIFRVFHSIKGSAGFIGLPVTSAVTHKAENLLDLLRKGKMILSKIHIDLFLELCDFFINLLNYIEKHFSEKGYEDKAEILIGQLEECIENTSEPPVKTENISVTSNTVEISGQESPGAETKYQNSPPAAADDFDSFITPEMTKQFVQESNDLLETLEQDLLELEKNPGDNERLENSFRALHSLKGNAGFLGFNDIQSVCHKAESFLEEVRSNRISAKGEQYAQLIQILDFIRSAVEGVDKGGEAGIFGVEGILDYMDEFLREVETETGDSREQHARNEEEEESVKNAGLTASAAPAVSPVKLKEEAPGVRQTQPQSISSEVIRVDIKKLNTLMDLVGEIVIAESMVAQHPDISGREMPDFEKTLLHLQKNIRELQELSTSMRMIPLTGLFRKMIRLVRDLSTKSGKRVELEIKGGDTEVDRSVIEHISDPLVHIIRNGVDHGIEPAEVRQAGGKPPEAKITLEARQIGGEIWISVDDDGQGLNRQKILKKAQEKKLISGSGEELSDEKVWNLIFNPGFSTTEKVTDISGRGVGMDVVQRNIEKIRGKVDISSIKGVGTTLTLRIPLTTAIIDGMLIRVRDSIYAVPMLDIKESVRVSGAQVVNMADGQEIVKIREDLLPVVRLHEMHHLEGETPALTDGILIIAENGGKTIALFADELVGQKQLVIKPLPSFIGELEGVSGCAIMGNGNIGLILDIASLIKTGETRGNYLAAANG
ncbi:MAG: chemotaxis protein CheA [Calditrichia bacterium]